MNWLMTLYLAILFILLTPGTLVYLPPRSSKLVTAITHGVIFALIWHFTHKAVWHATSAVI